MSNSTVLTEVEDGIATLTLSRPEGGNAIDIRLAEDLEAAAKRCAQDEAVRCLVLTGAGRMFCVGGDINAFGVQGGRLSGFLRGLASGFHRGQSQLLAMRKPLITLVNGPAAGAGMGLALSGDIVLMAQNAHFRPGYTGIGLTPDGGLTWLLPRLVGLRRAHEMIVTNQRIDAAEALALGMVSRVLPSEDLAAAGKGTALRLAAGAIGAMASVRDLIHAAASSTLAAHLDREVEMISAFGDAAEAAEGIAAFRERRQPDFRTKK